MKKNVLIMVLMAISFALYITSCSSNNQESNEEKTTVTVNPEDVVKHG